MPPRDPYEDEPGRYSNYGAGFDRGGDDRQVVLTPIIPQWASSTDPKTYQENNEYIPQDVLNVLHDDERSRTGAFSSYQPKQALQQQAGAVDVKTPVTYTQYKFQEGTAASRQYFLELWDGPNATKTLAAVTLPYVNAISCDQPLSVTRTWTFAGVPYEEHSGFQQRTFTIQGRSGYSDAALARFFKFRNFLEKYARLSAENLNAFVRAKDIRLALNFPWEGEAFWATVLNFKYQRETSSTRVSYIYSISIVTNGVASSRWDPANSKGYLGTDADDDHGLWDHWCGHRSKEAIAYVPPDLTRDIPEYELLNLHKFLRRIPSNTVWATPVALQVWELANACRVQLLLQLRQTKEPKRTELRFWVNLHCRWLGDLMIQAEIICGSRGVRIGEPIGQPGSAPDQGPRPYQGYPVTTITVTENQRSAFDIAAVYLNNRNYWTAVTSLNGMQDARTKSDGSPLGPGDMLLIPSLTGVDDIDPDTFYGRNLLFRSGDLVSIGDVDIATVWGLANFYQNFRHRMMTVRGQNKTYPGFGLPALIGNSDDTDVPAQVLSNVKLQTLSDHRVSEITEMSMTSAAGNLDVKLAITTALQEKTLTSFSYPF